MLKKIFPVMLVLILLAGSAVADCNVEMQFIVHHDDTESAVTAGAVIREKEILLLSGLFPSYAISLPSDNTDLSFFSDAHESFDSFAMPDSAEAVSSVVKSLKPETSAGVFSGDLFDEAHSVETGTVSMKDLVSAILEQSVSADNTTGLQDGTAAEILSLADQAFSGIQIVYSLYDSGKYFTMNGLDGTKTVFTLSFDFTDPASLRSVLGSSESGRNYYRAYELTVVSEAKIHLTAALISDPYKQGYRCVMNNTPVLTENWDIQLSENRKEISFTGEILPANDKKPIDISGTLSRENRPALLAKISFRGWDNSWFILSASVDETTVNTESLKVVSADIADDSEDFRMLFQEIVENGFPFYNVLVQAMPEEYRISLLQMN